MLGKLVLIYHFYFMTIIDFYAWQRVNTITNSSWVIFHYRMFASKNESQGDISTFSSQLF